jgi:hypothetical protein
MQANRDVIVLRLVKIYKRALVGTHSGTVAATNHKSV